MAAPRCNNCGRTEKPGTRFCGNCGNQLNGAGMEARRCPHCTSRLRENDRFCTSCGATC
jgi:predicted Zn-ribbon and HTH transcriptional regulator